MAQPSDQSKLETFVGKVHGSRGELGTLLRLAGRFQHHCDDAAKSQENARVQEAAPVTQRAAELLKARIAELSRASEAEAREAAMNIGRIGKALQEQKASEEMVKQFGPLLVLLRKRLDHATKKVRASKATVKSLDASVARVAPTVTADPAAPVAAPATPKSASRRKARGSKS
jgi:hypothetical protein